METSFQQINNQYKRNQKKIIGLKDISKIKYPVYENKRMKKNEKW